MCRRAQKVMHSTNLIFANEKMSLSDGLKGLSEQKSFALALNYMLHSDEPFESRFDRFSLMLEDIGAAKWTTATYFPFLVHPSKYMFVKPTVTQASAEVCRFEIAYTPKLNWQTYAAVLRFSSYLYEALADLQPRDMIDVQSFMWCIAPEI